MPEINSAIEELFLNTLWLLLATVVIGLCIAMLRVIYGMVHQWRRKLVILELIPHATNDKLPDATNQLFKSLHGLASTMNWREKVLGKKEVYSLEIVATKAEGIRYIITCDKHSVDSLKHAITSYTPDILINESTDYLKQPRQGRVLEFKQKSHFAYPLNSSEELSSHDPIGYITNAMAKLDKDELMAVQYVIRPIVSRKAEIINHRIMTNENLMPQLRRFNIPILNWLASLISTLLFGIADTVSDVAHNGSSKTSVKSASKDYEYKRQVARGIKPARTLTYFEHEMVESISQKLSQQLFAVDIRVLIAAKSKTRYQSRKKNIISAFNVYSIPKYQAIKLKMMSRSIMQRYVAKAFDKRVSSLLPSSRSILSVSEIASLYHFTNSMSAKTENVVKSLSKALPAPVSLKRGSDLDVLIGQNVYHGVTTDIGLTQAERERHLYIIGGTGNGKTTMLFYSILQDIRAGKGVAVLDPHGDLAERLLRYIPEERIADVIYMNPDDLTYPIGVNLLELSDATGDELLREKDVVTESTISVLRKIFSDDDSGGHRIEYVLRNAIQTALTLERPTLFTVFELLNDAKFRRSVVKTIEDKNLKDFWDNELGKAGEFQRVKMAAGITAKIGRFLFSASARRVLEQPKSTINFDSILADNKILICNFSKGLLGEDTSALFGTTILAKLQTAALRRARIQQDNRTPYYLYVDEFQNFATMSFVQMLSEARKYKLLLTMAEQSTSQQDQQRLVDIILANVGTIVCFRSGSPADERLALPLFSPYIQQGEIANLPAYTFYARIAAIQAQEPMSGTTVVVNSLGDEEIAQRVIESSRKLYAKHYVPIEKKEPVIEAKTKKETSRQQKKSQASKKIDETVSTAVSLT